MHALLHLFRRSSPPAPRAPARRPAPAPAEGDRPLGCGWFDSSHDLLSGVIVREGIIVVDNTVTHPS